MDGDPEGGEDDDILGAHAFELGGAFRISEEACHFVAGQASQGEQHGHAD